MIIHTKDESYGTCSLCHDYVFVHVMQPYFISLYTPNQNQKF